MNLGEYIYNIQIGIELYAVVDVSLLYKSSTAIDYFRNIMYKCS